MIKYCLSHWAEQQPHYVAMDNSGVLYWTPHLEDALIVPLEETKKGPIPDHLNWLPVFIPDIVSGE